MTDETTAPHLFQPGRAKTGGRAKGTPSRHVSIKAVEQRVYRQINAALARHERTIDAIFEKRPIEALKLDASLNRTTVQLLELLHQRSSTEGGAPASSRQIEAAAARAAEAAPITDEDCMKSYLRLISGDDDGDALQIPPSAIRSQIAKQSEPHDAPSVVERQIPPATTLEPDPQPSADLRERSEPFPDPPAPPRTFDAQPIPDGPQNDWGNPHVTLVMPSPPRR